MAAGNLRDNQEWRPIGGVSTSKAGISKQGTTGIKTSTVYAQAMVLFEPD